MAKTFDEVYQEVKTLVNAAEPKPNDVKDCSYELQRYLTDNMKEVGGRLWVGVKNALCVISGSKWKNRTAEAAKVAMALLDGCKTSRGMGFSKSKSSDNVFENTLWYLEAVTCVPGAGLAPRVRWDLKLKQGKESLMFQSFARQEDALAVIEGRRTLAL